MTREFVLKFLGDVSGLNRATDEAAGRFDNFNRRLAVVTGAGVAAGAGLEALARGQADNSRAVERLTTLTGLQSGAVRDLATELASVDSPLEEVLAVMEQGTKVGAEGAEGLRQYAEFWDLVGDATGEETTRLAELTSALQSVGVDVNDLASAQDALGFAQRNTTDGALGFLELLEKKGPEIREFGLDANDTAALLGAMEQELGLTGRTARTEFEQAINDSDGTMQGLLDSLGLSQQQFQDYRDQVDGAGQVLEELAEANTGNFTPMERIQQKVEELTFGFGDQIQALANLAPLLLGLGPAMKVGEVAASALSKIGLGSLLPLLAPPQGLILLGLAAVVAAGVLVWQNWDTIKEKAGQLAQWLGDKLGPMKDAVVGIFNDIAGSVGGVIEKIGNFLEMLGNIPSAGDVAGALGSKIPGAGSGLADAVGGFFGGAFDSGGVVPGPIGAPRLVLAHGGETILPTHRGGMGGSTIVLNFNAPLGATSAEMQRIVRRALTEAGIRGIGA